MPQLLTAVHGWYPLLSYETNALTTTSAIDATKMRVKEQESQVRSLEPGSKHHRVAVNVLLLLQDSLHVLTEAHELIQAARSAASTALVQRNAAGLAPR